MSIKHFIQKSGDEVAIVIYDAPLPPKYFRLTKRFIRTLFVATPILICFIIFSFFLWGLGDRLKDTPTPTLPAVMTESDTKLRALEEEVKSLSESNLKLTEKVSSGTSEVTAEDPYLILIKKPYGMQNLLSQNKVTLDQFEMINNNNRVNLKFQIISSVPDKKVTGHVIVFMVSESGMMVYPKEANALLTQGIKYSEGEPFSVSRLRPTNAEFAHQLTGGTVRFIIYIFSREGDLLLVRETENFKVGTKS